MGRYGTLVNKQELKGGEADLKEGDFLQFGHKSSFRCSKECLFPKTNIASVKLSKHTTFLVFQNSKMACWNGSSARDTFCPAKHNTAW